MDQGEYAASVRANDGRAATIFGRQQRGTVERNFAARETWDGMELGQGSCGCDRAVSFRLLPRSG